MNVPTNPQLGGADSTKALTVRTATASLGRVHHFLHVNHTRLRKAAPSSAHAR